MTYLTLIKESIFEFLFLIYEQIKAFKLKQKN